MLAGGGTVSLFEFGKQLGQHFRCDAHAGVPHFKANQQGFSVGSHEARRQQNDSTISEFYGIGGEI